MQERFVNGSYQYVAGFCKAASVTDIEAQGWSLNPGSYVGVAARTEDDGDFRERLESPDEELERLNAGARVLEERIGENVGKILDRTIFRQCLDNCLLSV
jgi:type I restriction enzyme M protein